MGTFNYIRWPTPLEWLDTEQIFRAFNEKHKGDKAISV